MNLTAPNSTTLILLLAAGAVAWLLLRGRAGSLARPVVAGPTDADRINRALAHPEPADLTPIEHLRKFIPKPLSQAELRALVESTRTAAPLTPRPPLPAA